MPSLKPRAYLRAAVLSLGLSWACPARAADVRGPSGGAPLPGPKAAVALPPELSPPAPPAAPEAGIPAAPAANAIPYGGGDGSLPLAAPAAAALPERFAPQLPVSMVPLIPARPLPGGTTAPETRQEILEQLAPENSASVSPEQARDLAGRLIAPGEGLVVEAGTPVPAGPEPGMEARGGFLQAMKDIRHHRAAYFRQLWWYTVTHIADRQDRNMWPRYRARWRAARDQGARFPVAAPRRFFARMRVMGESGIFYVLGFSSLLEPAVQKEAAATFRRYFKGPAVGEAEADAFEAFMLRARSYNAGRRSHANFRKHVRDALLAASQMPGEKIAPYFRSLILTDLVAETAHFQAVEAAGVLEAFRNAVEETIREEDPDAKDRVIGAVLLGSFANGSPNRKSDFDAELVTADGKRGRMGPFIARLEARWKALGLERHPITVHESPEPPSKGVLKRIHHSDYIVISPDPFLVKALSRAPDEPPYFTVERRLTLKGRLGRLLQFVAVYLTTLYADLRGLWK